MIRPESRQFLKICNRSGLRLSYRLRAFSLIELLVVVIILSLILLIAVPRLDSLTPRTRLQAAARELAVTIRQAREQAILTSTHSGLRFDIHRGEYWIVLGKPDEGTNSFFIESSTGLQELGRERLTRRRLPRGVRFLDLEFSRDAIFPSGLVGLEITPMGVFSSCSMHLVNEEDSEVTLRVNGLIGTFNYYDGYQPLDVFEPALTPK